MITSGHLCTGYDGLGRGLSLLRPHETLWHAESDVDMAATLAKHEPGVRNVGNLITAPWHLAPRPDVVTAGVPCQPISSSGHKRGDQDVRYLWPYAVDVFRIVRPPFILLENVERLIRARLTDGTSMLGRWLADLRDLRYAVTWTVIGACVVGAPHHRHRFYAWCVYRPTGPVPEARRIETPCAEGVLLPTPTAAEGKSGPGGSPMRKGGPNLRTVARELGDSWGRYAPAIERWEGVLGRPAPRVEPAPRGGSRLSAELAEWMMGLPEGLLTGHLPRRAALVAAGNGAVPLQAAAAQRLLAG